MAEQEECHQIKQWLFDAFEYLMQILEEYQNCLKDDGYILRLEDHRHAFSHSIDYLKVYPDGKLLIAIDSNYKVRIYHGFLESAFVEELCTFAESNVTKFIKKKKYLECDDRCYWDAYVLTYGFKWKNLSQNDMIGYYQDYFMDKAPDKIIEKLMNVQEVQTLFIDKKEDNMTYRWHI